MLKVETDTRAGAVALRVAHSEPCIDSRLLAHHLGIQHKNVIESIGKYADQFMSFGKVAFQTEPSLRFETGINATRERPGV